MNLNITWMLLEFYEFSWFGILWIFVSFRISIIEVHRYSIKILVLNSTELLNINKMRILKLIRRYFNFFNLNEVYFLKQFYSVGSVSNCSIIIVIIIMMSVFNVLFLCRSTGRRRRTSCTLYILKIWSRSAVKKAQKRVNTHCVFFFVEWVGLWVWPEDWCWSGTFLQW